MDIQEIKKELDKIERTSFGISIPELRKFAKKIAKNDYKVLIYNNDFLTYELKLLHAFVIGYIKEDINVLLKYFETMNPDLIPNNSLLREFIGGSIFEH